MLHFAVAKVGSSMTLHSMLRGKFCNLPNAAQGMWICCMPAAKGAAWRKMLQVMLRGK